jgi:hypothetical protein
MTGCRTRRIDVPAESLVGAASYADAFALELDEPDGHTAPEWVRQGLEGSGPLMRGLIRWVHAHVLRFALGPADEDHVLGWRVLVAEPEVVHLSAAGALFRGDIIARRTSPDSARLMTALRYERPVARPVWLLVGPLHRTLAPYLLRRAAVALAERARA